MKVILFKDPWYNEMISQVQQEFGKDCSADAAAIATALLVGQMCVAQAIDHAFDNNHDDSVTSATFEVAAAIDRLAERKIVDLE